MRRTLTFVALISALTAQKLYADSIAATSGVLTGSASSITDFSIVAGDLRITGTAADTKGGLQQCGPCLPGSAFSFSSAWEIEGQLERGGASESVVGRFRFKSEKVRVPDLPAEQGVRLMRAFTFLGTVRPLEGGGPPLRLTGTGVATFGFRHFTDEGVFPILLRYDFTSSDAVPTPEPTTLILVASGLVGAVASRRRKKSHIEDSKI